MDRKRKERIHKESKMFDDTLPFKLGKPKKTMRRDVYHECSKCGKSAYISRHTVLYVCSGCGELERIHEE